MTQLSRARALQILGLKDGAGGADVEAAYRARAADVSTRLANASSKAAEDKYKRVLDEVAAARSVLLVGVGGGPQRTAHEHGRQSRRPPPLPRPRDRQDGPGSGISPNPLGRQPAAGPGDEQRDTVRDLRDQLRETGEEDDLESRPTTPLPGSAALATASASPPASTAPNCRMCGASAVWKPQFGRFGCDSCRQWIDDSRTEPASPLVTHNVNATSGDVSKNQSPCSNCGARGVWTPRGAVGECPQCSAPPWAQFVDDETAARCPGCGRPGRYKADYAEFGCHTCDRWVSGPLSWTQLAREGPEIAMPEAGRPLVAGPATKPPSRFGVIHCQVCGAPELGWTADERRCDLCGVKLWTCMECKKAYLSCGIHVHRRPDKPPTFQPITGKVALRHWTWGIVGSAIVIAILSFVLVKAYGCLADEATKANAPTQHEIDRALNECKNACLLTSCAATTEEFDAYLVKCMHEAHGIKPGTYRIKRRE